MNYLQAVILAIVEGITEFLPISSTGHLILTSNLLSIRQDNFFTTFEIFIQLGAIFAIVFLYFQTFTKNIEVWKRIIAAFIPTGIVGFFVYDFVKSYLLTSELITVVSLFVGGLILIGLEYLHKEEKSHHEDLEKLTLKNAFLIGFFQSISIIPGVSRAGATIIGGLVLGLKRKAAVEFSFLIAVPTMLAASGYDLIKSEFNFTGAEIGLLAAGFIGSFIVAILAVKFFLRFIKTHTFIPFGIYRIILAILYWLFLIR